MSSIVFQNGLLGLFRLLTTTIVAGWVGSPMSWSPDSQWLSYTVAPGFERDDREPDWLFDTSRQGIKPPDPSRPGESRGPSGPMTYRIWATHRDGESSVLIEESAWPLSAPAWSPQGRSIAFGRFVPASIEPHQVDPRGRLEVVIQDSLGRKQTFLAVPDFELDPKAREEFPHAIASWSQDGQFLAFPKPGRSPSILIFKIESRKLLQTIDRAGRPAWSPDGSRLAFIRYDAPDENNLQLLERRGHNLVPARPNIDVGRVKSAPYWTGDGGRSLFVVVEKPGGRPSELDLTRVFVESGDSLRVLPLAVAELLPRVASIRGVAIDCQREEERCFFAVDFDGRDTEVVWSVPIERKTVKRFHPVDNSLRVGSLAISPDGHFLALRFGTPGRLTPPAIQDVHDATTDKISPVIPDEAARGAWLAVLSRTARTLLVDSLPPASAEGGVARRPTLLPLPGEIPAQHPLLFRLARLGRIGSAVCDQSGRRNVDDDEPDVRPATTPEDRLFFDYLRGDFAAAATDINAVEPRVAAPPQRLSLLSLQAQILYSKGNPLRARAIADYLISAEGGPIRRVEETPAGIVMTTEPDSGQIWARYLSARISANPGTAPSPSASPAELPPDHLPHPFAPVDPLEIERERGAGAAPFAPFAPEIVPEPIRRLDVQRLPAGDRPPPQPQPIDPRRRRGLE
jgi:Tol biopolymer transport system component